jgi:hypothetical protein
MLVDLMLVWQFSDEELICATFDKKVILNLFCGKCFRIDDLPLGKFIHRIKIVKEVLFEHLNG